MIKGPVTLFKDKIRALLKYVSLSLQTITCIGIGHVTFIKDKVVSFERYVHYLMTRHIIKNNTRVLSKD